ncbi:MAG: PHP domain-containing protein [Actinobacteria bacterium]|nr:MAG: PHP domain-containing protein [Actinomycetota bacterium]
MQPCIRRHRDKRRRTHGDPSARGTSPDAPLLAAFPVPADLHIHSTASDGTLSPTELVELARAEGIETIAVSDHDSVDGVASAMSAGAALGVDVIPAVELSAETDGRSVHILGYFVDHADEGLLAHLATLRQTRLDRARELVRVLADAGYAVSLDDVLARTAGGSVGRAHIARALVDAGHVPTTGAAFDRLIGRGKPFYVAKPVASPGSVIATIKGAGGLAVLAHPSVSGAEDLIERFRHDGLDGIEVFHAQQGPSDRERLLAVATRFEMAITGGSDFHGPGEGRTRLGDGGLTDEALRSFMRFAASRTGRRS